MVKTTGKILLLLVMFFMMVPMVVQASVNEYVTTTGPFNFVNVLIPNIRLMKLCDKELCPPLPGIVFVMDCSSSIDSSEREGMRSAILSAVSNMYTIGRTFGVVKFSETATWNVYPRVIHNSYDLQSFKNEVCGMSTCGTEFTAMDTGVTLAATGMASYMIIMTDGNPGAQTPAMDACYAARDNGQKISIAHYPHEYVVGFPFAYCSNSDGYCPTQPIGYHQLVNTPGEMVSKVTYWAGTEHFGSGSSNDPT